MIPTADEIRERHDRLLARLRAVAERSDHDPDRLRIVAVTKAWPVEVARSAVDAGLTAAQTTATPNPSTDSIWICPMDKDIRKHNPGTCPRCGMKLVTDIPEDWLKLIDYDPENVVKISPVRPVSDERMRTTSVI